MKLLQNRDQQLCLANETRRPSRFFEAHFFNHLRLKDNAYVYQNVVRWTRKDDVFEIDKLVFPVSVNGNHWSLVVIYPQCKEIHYFDSLRYDGSW